MVETNRVIVRIPQSEVEEFGKERFNSNNHYGPEGQPKDYFDVIRQSYANKWLPKFHLFYHVVNLQKKDLFWLAEADAIGRHTKKFPKMFEDELEDIVQRYKILDQIFTTEPNGFFVRSDSVSLKEGVHGAGPYHSFKDLIESLVTCIAFHTPLSAKHDYLSLYLLPWQTIDRNAEFRVFIFNNKITAISQQHLYDSNELLSKLNEDERKTLINKWMDILVDYFYSTICTKITHISSYVMDIAILEPLGQQPRPYFIEINSFGKQYPSGSSLFHWLLNEEVLYGDGTCIEFRYST